jgi:hypothetical protein
MSIKYYIVRKVTRNKGWTSRNQLYLIRVFLKNKINKNTNANVSIDEYKILCELAIPAQCVPV